MRSGDLQGALVNWSVKNAGCVAHRPYISLDTAGECLIKQYEAFMFGTPVDITERLKYRLSTEIEMAVIERIQHAGLTYTPGKDLSLYDGLVQGRPCGFIDGDLLEIRTIGREAWFPEQRELPNRVFYKVQAYMHFTNTTRTHVVYMAQDTGNIRVLSANTSFGIAQRIVTNLEALIHAVHTRRQPLCTCRRCQPVLTVLES